MQTGDAGQTPVQVPRLRMQDVGSPIDLPRKFSLVVKKLAGPILNLNRNRNRKWVSLSSSFYFKQCQSGRMSEVKDPERSLGFYRHAAGQIWCLSGKSPLLHRLPINGISDISPAAVFYRRRVALCRKQFRFATKCEINNHRLGSAATYSNWLDLRSVKRITSLGTGNKDDLQRSSSTPSQVHFRYRLYSQKSVYAVTDDAPGTQCLRI